MRPGSMPSNGNASNGRWKIMTETLRLRLALVDRQRALVQLQNRQMASRGKQRADGALRPAAVRILPGRKEVEDHFPIFAPRQPFGGLRSGKQLGVAVLAEHIEGLGIV